MLSFQKLRVYQAAAALDTLRVMQLVTADRYSRGIELLEGIVGMLTKMT